MRDGQASRTAVLVCMGRAVADRDPAVPELRDPTAMSLLPADARARVERLPGRGGGLRAGFDRVFLRRQAAVMAARTIAIDDAIRRAATPQVVILGAGLDGRAWRMPELADAVVFEVDHPDTQRDKRARAAELAPAAGDIRFVPVDFTRDSLEEALEAAGHDPTAPTTWIWEGVVMYLSLEDVESTLAIVDRRSAPGSCLIVAYHSPSVILWIVGPVVRRMGEPLRSVFRPHELRALLARYRFAVDDDRDIASIGAEINAHVGRATRPINHLRIAVATRGSAAQKT